MLELVGEGAEHSRQRPRRALKRCRDSRELKNDVRREEDGRDDTGGVQRSEVSHSLARKGSILSSPVALSDAELEILLHSGDAGDRNVCNRE
jgi:hypothetical protein